MYPVLPLMRDYQQDMDVFAGYNHNERINENEFYDMKNLTSDAMPVLSPRKPRGLYLAEGNVQGMIAKDGLCYVDGRYFVSNGYRVDMGLAEDEESVPKRLVSMGAYVIILPDKMYINTANLSDFGRLEAEVSTRTAVTFSPCKEDGTVRIPDYVQASEPASPANMALWMDTSATPHSLKQYSTSAGMWTSVVSVFVKIQATGIGEPFSEYDGVQLSGLSDIGEQLGALEGATVVYASGSDFIVVPGLLDDTVTVDSSITVSRKMPEVDFLIESGNRLWGCRYGLSNDGSVVNELYASKLGDFKNWNCFMGLSTDSYAVSLGTDGQFTGAIAHGGYPLFFKENCLHKVYGQYPANFQVQTTACRGVQKGSGNSLAIVNEVLYYKSQHAVCAYDGSIPVEMSGALGNAVYSNAIAAAHGNKYYVSMLCADGRELFVYDTVKGVWHKEDDIPAESFCSCRDELYCAAGGKIISMLGSGQRAESSVEWMAQTGIINASSPERAYLKRLNIRMVLEAGSSLTISAEYDSDGVWEQLGYMTGFDLQSFTLPVRPRRCDHLRLKLEGVGRCHIFSISKTMSGGSDKP